jgi:hypothetical protein
MNTISLFIALSLYYVVVAISIQQILEEDKIFIIIGKETFLVNLIENPITKELISVLPLKTNLIEEKNSTKQLPLSIKIETENYPSLKLSSVEGHKGDIYLHNGKQLVLFNETETIINNGEYTKLGFIEQADELFDVMKKYKRSNILLWNTLDYANHKGRISPYTYYNSIMNYFTLKVLTFFCFLFL